ncbi:MBL fold metallo-hydrolase [Yoonia sp.]|jgi:ribonuclease Z|uniref:MBL fold metallo-hydrolase n=1 Tax=Yoonia sp. TaxID=2212373 RepID=UPI0040486E3F
MKLTILGSGSPEAYARRASSGFLLEVGSDRILFDCGGGVVDNLIRSGRLPKDITHLFFTHYHSDHMMDYARLVHAAWDEGALPLKVFGPNPLAKITDGYFGRDGVLNNDLRARTELPQSQQVWVARGGTLPRPWPAPEVTEITAGFTYQGDGWQLVSANATHAQPILDCLGFSVVAGGKKFVYSGDTAINSEITALSRDADLLLHWCYRGAGERLHPALQAFSPDPGEVADMAQSVGVKRLLLSHFRVHMDSAEGHQKALDDMSARFQGVAGIVEDLDVFDI